MEFRLHLTPTDLGKIRLSPRPSPVVETALSALLLRQATTDPFVRRWRARAANALGPAGAPIMQVMGSGLVQISDLLYRHALTAASYDEAVEAFLATPQPIISRDLTHVIGDRPAAAARDLRDGNRNVMEAVAANLRRYHRAVADPQWINVVRQGHIAFATQRRSFAENGVDWLLRNLYPTVRWDPPVLTLYIPCPTDERFGSCRYHHLHDIHSDVFLQGRGLVLVPSLFVPSFSCWLWCDDYDDRPAILIYPATTDRTALESPDARRPGQLAPLLGSTRAAVMEALGDRPRSTTELARAVKISIASASEHAAVLRNAGLIVSTREGMSVTHSLTANGAALLQDVS
ncbi:helix-turn-helix protein [Micromonospora kangleipakensis]|uniref:Helix-turn-helix protein n=1 Tax=Micromonospora kangleipakensis TaxID=1077942 RepID=A0A4Q8BD15_9ACTN|nr:winged helix-turn-helix domain-containing protein [Micromonospora kangleipakensis]RZU74969.1 helix-turn-helix protein [Micromonospora kangleipakensis]